VVAESNEGNNACADTVTATATVTPPSSPDLRVTKTNTVGGVTTVGTPWTWTLTVVNVGGAAATLTNGQLILADNLPAAGLTYGAPTAASFSNVTGSANVSCAIASGNLSCVASGGSVTLGATTGSFTVTVLTIPTAPGTYANPRSGGVCGVDPNNMVGEANEADNACADAVTVTASAGSPPVDPQGGGVSPPKDEKEETRSLTPEQQQQKDHTNAGGHDQIHTEGNVLSVELRADGPTLLVTIGLGRGETLIVEIKCGAAGLVGCADIRPGDYVEIDGWQGGKEEDGHFIAETVTISR